eukprot:gene17430-19861_t
MDCLKYLHSQKQLFGPNISVKAVRGGVLQSSYMETRILEYVCNHGGTITESAFLEAVKLGTLPILKYLVQHNCFCDAPTAHKTASLLPPRGANNTKPVCTIASHTVVRSTGTTSNAVSKPIQTLASAYNAYFNQHWCPYSVRIYANWQVQLL